MEQVSSQIIQTKLPCPDQEECCSSDAAVLNEGTRGDDGERVKRIYCFSCGNYWWEDQFPQGYGKVLGGIYKKRKANGTLNNYKTIEDKALKEFITGGKYVDLDIKDTVADRGGISKETCEFFDVKFKEDKKIKKDENGEEIDREVKHQLILPYYDSDGITLVGQKIRTEKTPKGYWVGESKKANLFGSQKFREGNRITIVEGELDALAYRDLMGDFPVVSVNNGAQSAYKEIKKNLEYFNNFNEIRICFDSDEQGKKAAEQVAKLFPAGKARIVHMRHYKDPNDYLRNRAYQEFKKCWWDAVPYTPAGIVLGTELFDRITEKLRKRKENIKVNYPFEKLNELTYGIRQGEMVTLVSGSGIGKSSLLAEIMYHILKNTDDKIGVMMMEESVEMANLRLMSLFANKPLHLPDTEYNDEELRLYYEHTVGLRSQEDEARVISFDHFGSNNVEEIISKVDFMSAMGAKYIFLDHISIIVSDQQSGDERKALDEIATKLRTKVAERDICLFVVSHLRRPGGKPHEEGGETSLADIRGTAGIGQLSDIVLGFERNQQDQDSWIRNITKVRVLKNRFSGLTGLSSFVWYNKDTNRLEEVSEEEYNNHIKDTTFQDESEEGDDFREPLSVFDTTSTGKRLEEER